MAKALILCACLALAACASPRGSFCQISSPIRPSQATIDAMSDAEVADVLRHNLRGQELCGWRP